MGGEGRADADWLRNRRVLVVARGLDVTSAVIAGLMDHGARVTLLSDNDDPLAQTRPALERTRATFASRQEVEQAVARAVAQLGIPELVVLSVLPFAGAGLAPITSLRSQDWQSGACDAIRCVLHLLQALSAHMQGRGGAIVMLAPSLSLVGCRELVALSTALEGQRGLMKSVARQWGAAGVTLNWIAAAPRALNAAFDAAPLASKPDAVTVALGRAIDPCREITPILGFLASEAGRTITGATLTLDGGEWMVP